MITSSAMRRPALAALAAESMWYTTDRWQEAQPGGRSPSNTRLVTHGTHLHGHTMRGKHQARRPILPLSPLVFGMLTTSVNQRALSGPVVMLVGWLPDGSGNSLIVPVGVMRPILPLWSSVNQRLPSGPAVMPNKLLRVGTGNSLIWPAGVMRPILPTSVPLCRLGIISVNQMAPSGPVVISLAKLLDDSENSLIWPAGVMRPILPGSVNQRLPSGPAVMPLA